ncbi:MAG: hypothetical protein ACRDSR_09600 [Pseudonocardiaceae bacterium]
MQFAEYQRAARETSQLRLGGPQSVIAPMLGLASEAGSVLNVYRGTFETVSISPQIGNCYAKGSAIFSGMSQPSRRRGTLIWKRSPPPISGVPETVIHGTSIPPIPMSCQSSMLSTRHTSASRVD